MSFTVFIGLEIHIELKTKSKMFCRCLADHFGKKPNSQTCPVCLGLPGALPVANRKAIESIIMAGMSLNCKINSFSKFDRKNYTYPDLPKGYQISQYDLPLCGQGKFDGVAIRRIHLEEDTGKMVHKIVAGVNVSLIDFNRSGVPLMEIVTEPDIISSKQAGDFLKKLRQVVRDLGISDADMEKGQMRCEPTVNLEIKQDGKTYHTPLAEIKNINSFRFVQKAIEFEIERQKKEFDKTGIEKQDGNKTTRGWDEKLQKTVLQREKEEAADYRYFPEPDLPPIRLTSQEIEKIKKSLPEMAKDRKQRIVKDYDLKDYPAKSIDILISQDKMFDLFEKTAALALKEEVAIKDIFNAIVNKKINIDKNNPEELIKFLKEKSKPSRINQYELGKIIEQIVSKNSKMVEEFRNGKEAVVEFLVGQVMSETKGQADPNQARQMLREKMKSA